LTYASWSTSITLDPVFRINGVVLLEWHALVDGADVGGTAGTPTQIADGTLTFNSAGALGTEVVNSSSASFVGATANQAIKFDFGDAITTDGGTGLTGTTQFARGSGPLHLHTDAH